MVGSSRTRSSAGTLADQPGNSADLGQWAGEAVRLLHEAVGLVETGLRAGLVDPMWDRLFAAAVGMEQLRDAATALAAFGSEHGDFLGPAFRGEGTDWDDLRTTAAYAGAAFCKRASVGRCA